MAQCPLCGRSVEEEREHCSHCGARQNFETTEESPVVEGENSIPPERQNQRGFGGMLGIILGRMSKKPKQIPFIVPLLICVLLLGAAFWITVSNTTNERMTAEETVDAFLTALEQQDAEALLKVVSRADNSVILNEETIKPFMEIYNNVGDLSALKSKLLAGKSNNGAQLTQTGKDYTIMLTPVEATIDVDMSNVSIGEGDTLSITVAGTEYPLDINQPTLNLNVLPGDYQLIAHYHSNALDWDCNAGSAHVFVEDGAVVTLEVSAPEILT